MNNVERPEDGEIDSETPAETNEIPTPVWGVGFAPEQPLRDATLAYSASGISKQLDTLTNSIAANPANIEPENTTEKNTTYSFYSEMFTSQIESIGDFANFCGYTFIWLCWQRPRWNVLAHSFYSIGVLSLPVVMLTGMFIGMVLAVQTYSQFKAIGMEAVLGGVISFSLVRELGPVLAATMLAGRVGSSIAAEIGSMRVSEQIEALASLGTSPIHYLVVPRFLASLFLIPALTVIADFMGVFGGAIYCTKILGIDEHFYWEHGRSLVGSFDVLAGMFKSVFFGGIIALISCHQGFRCENGAEGVGKAATKSFVLSFVAILFIDLILGIFIDRVQSMLGFTPGTIVGA